MRRLSILGSTGSIGAQALEVVAGLPGEFEVVALSARSNAALLAEQARTFNVAAVALTATGAVDELRSRLAGSDIEILAGREGLLELAGRDNAHICLNALVGGPGMAPTIAAVQAGVDVALSNKESMVMAGGHITRLAARKKVAIYPVDSEHSAIWQCLAGENRADVRRLILTGSGGPFRTWPQDKFDQVTRAEALNHPNWDMGAKITIDSATMMNKGLEVIEAHWLFHVPPEKIDIVVHPQSIIHSMVEFADGSVKAQLGMPNMKVPIQYALTYPRRRPADWERLDLIAIGTLTFEPPDREKFPCIALAYEALERGGTAPAALNLANDLAVQAFLDDHTTFANIPVLLEQAMTRHPYSGHPALEDLAALEAWVSRFVTGLL